MSSKDETVRVVMRCRPFSRKEIEDKRERIVELDERVGTFRIYKPGARTDNSEPPKEFTFDGVFDSDSKQMTVYNETARPIVNSVMQGYNGTIFAYGQTGTGKTHTMVGPDNWQEEAEELRGIIPNAFHHIFDTIERTKDKQFLVRASYLEIYQEEVRDLLGKDTKKKLDLHENADSGVYVRDLTTFVVKDVAECDKVMSIGSKAKSVGATMMNDRSSRSHTIFCVTIESSETIDGQTHYAVGKLNLVDLAGSEKQSKTQASGERLKEATKINLSLSALGNVIKALVDPKCTHVPYRDSKLTRLLQDSLGGNTKTVMVANTGPADYNYDETLNTLRYASRAKSIKNKPRINEDPKDAMLREYQEEINRLKAMLLAQNGGALPEGFVMPPGWGPGGAAGGGGGGGGGGSGGGSGGVTTIQGVAPELLEELKNKTEEEKRAILEEKNMAEAEKERILADMEKQNDALNKERKQREALARKLKAMQEKLIVGGVNLIDKTKEQEEALKQKEFELKEQRLREAQLKLQMKEAEEERRADQEHFSSLQEEVEIKTKQLKKIKAKFEAAKSEITDLQEEFQQEREDFLDTIRDLSKQLKLKLLIINHFIPPEEVLKIEKRAEFDEDTQEWKLSKLSLSLSGNNQMSKRPPSASGARRPMSRSAIMSSVVGDDNVRYRGDNVLNLDLDLVPSSTADYEAGMIHGLNGDLRSPFEEDTWLMHTSNGANVYFTYGGDEGERERERDKVRATGKPPMKPGQRPTSAVRKGSQQQVAQPQPQEQYPTARGLVSRERRMM